MAHHRTWLRGLFGSDEEPADAVLQAPPPHSGPGLFAEASNDFALAMYAHLRQRPGNLFLSPFSVRTALAMPYAGASGETAAQMGKALRFLAADETLHIAFAEIIQRLNAAGSDQYEMAVANSLWCQDGAPLQSGFRDVVARHYCGGMNVVDFRRSVEAARARINLWVEDKTKHKIKELIGSGGLDADTRLVLVNAVYFKGKWVLQFRKAATRDEPFYVEGGGNVRAPLMHQQGEVRYLQAGGFQAVDLAYRGGDLCMLVLLPDRNDGLRALETQLSARLLRDCVASMLVREVELFLPRFRMTWGTVDLATELRTLGMPLAFTRAQADFSGINGHEPPDEESLFISAVYHKAFAEVNEEGTEAAAATGVAHRRLGAFPHPAAVPMFRADHPFLFAIRDRKSGTILFLGRVADPTRES